MNRSLSTRFGIRAGESVLDIGCGGKPFPLATHLADVDLSDHSARFGLPVPEGPRPVYECSVEDTPFRDKQFDFVYCAHVLEHVDDPGRACAELARIGRRGYVETPRSWTEYVFSAADHKWLVDFEMNTLIFREKTELESGDPLGLRYSIFTWLKDPDFLRHWNSSYVQTLWNVRFLWYDSFDFMVLPREARTP